MNLKQIGLFASLDNETLGLLRSVARSRTLNLGEILFYAGEEPKQFLILAHGEVEVFKHDKKGNEIIIGEFKAPSLIAEMATLERTTYPATARSNSDVIIYEIDLADLEPYISKNSSPLAQVFINSLTKKIQHLESVLKYATISNASARTASFLIDNEQQLSILTQRKIASNLMLTPEGLSRILKRFKENGLVEVIAKKLYIANRAKLLEIAG